MTYFQQAAYHYHIPALAIPDLDPIDLLLLEELNDAAPEAHGAPRSEPCAKFAAY